MLGARFAFLLSVEKGCLRKADDMRLVKSGSDWWRRFLGSRHDRRSSVASILRQRYVREKQHAMRYRQHAERMLYPQFRDALLGIAAEEEKHAESIGVKITDLGEKLPNVIPIYIAKEQNSWFYLRTDLEEEQRCAGELQDDLPDLGSEFPEIAELFERIENDGKRHRAQLREMLARSDPQSVAPA
jgi:rubrerythrin